MFVAEEQCLDVDLGAARMRLADLLHSKALITSSANCYEQGVTGLARVGLLDSASGVSKLVDGPPPRQPPAPQIPSCWA